ncbi:RAI1-domain-containing protein [Dothidotthia symphoricarpi CBS 119687]|uniref:Decapping nuclease n=1 Tax=Dothidotthia symphoricarpi CBS 119687 TaxID=1392245 RepID=A0A6A6ABV3_9PLEO|nr:RAI1-domain-containing protein [Dothidotthia symphoricarpi CBS 119687]KAF2128378.1 RAI1-domain-containing protein [Dothidotthia symphoricarpi CBS 119687]
MRTSNPPITPDFPPPNTTISTPMSEQRQDVDPAAVSAALNLPSKPPSPTPDAEDASPPRKRPRTRAPPQADIPAPKPTVHEPIAPAPKQYVQPPTSPSQHETHRFPIQPLHRFHGASATIKRPREVAHFSYDDNHEYRDDESSINYYVPPPLGADLKEGFDTFRHHEDKEDQHLDSLLQALMEKEQKEGSDKRVKADFVTWRGMMTKILTAPFDHFAEFNMFATLHDSTIYIEEDFPSRFAARAAESSHPPPRSHHPDPQSQSREMMTYWGYKFETLSLIPTPPSSTTPEQIRVHQRAVTSNHAQHCSIVSTSFGPHSLLLGGEVDGLLAPKPANPDEQVQWVELKTTEELPPPQRQQHRDILKFERKLLKFWAQSFLLGVPKVVVGFRSKTGILRGLQTFNTHEIPGMVRRGTGCWDGNVCINFAAGFLGWLKEVVQGEGVYSVVLRRKSGVVEVTRVGDGTGNIVSEEFLAWRRAGDEGDEGEDGGGARS